LAAVDRQRFAHSKIRRRLLQRGRLMGRFKTADPLLIAFEALSDIGAAVIK